MCNKFHYSVNKGMMCDLEQVYSFSLVFSVITQEHPCLVGFFIKIKLGNINTELSEILDTLNVQ